MRNKVHFDEANAIPDLQDEWMSPDKLARDKLARSRQRLKQERLTFKFGRNRGARLS